jgi:hypothetical protein
VGCYRDSPSATGSSRSTTEGSEAASEDLLTPPWQAKAVADAIPKARFELVIGPGSSHGMHIERPEDLVRIVTGFLDEHPLQLSSAVE